MAELVVVYKTPTDPAAFDRYYTATHIPLAKKMPGLRNYQVSKGDVAGPGGPTGAHLVAMLTFDSVAAIQAAFASPEGQAAVGDLPNFASGGADVMFFETSIV
ncbi:EthD family reductase [Tardiphaga sp.]|uniref:EthD family reductase n=1 Tax=Tardiphaga sp. TaxID=1926292 RepID=UPI002610A40B|nr:EthD family reductase [Tardiphaga sp.]MDB5617166.1 Ethyl tert-butyl ether degradation EthD [Tardiphaga sp.]